MAEKGTLYREVSKWLVIAVAVACVGLVTALSQNTTYTKEETNRQHDRIELRHERDVDRLYEGIDQIQQNVDWLVRQQGGEPIRTDPEEDR